MNVRIRGIYATALTHLLREAGHTVVQASPPIRERFDSEFAVEEYGVAVETTDDRQGVGVHGDPDAVSSVADRLADVGRDAFAWSADAPREAVFVGRVEETPRSGAVVDCGSCSGFLPYSNTEEYVEEGDHLPVQVSEPAPPWSDDPVLDTQFEVGGGLVRLVCDGSADESGGPGTAADLTDLLPNDSPDGWRARWTDASDDADLDALSAALADASERAAEIDEALADAPETDPGALWDGCATAWVWFGREARFALDDIRRGVCPTMAGHHRIKAGSEEASAAVGFAEAVCNPDGAEFPVETVLGQFGPHEGSSLKIVHGKPDGRRIVLGEGRVSDRDGSAITVRREMTSGGTYDGLGVERRAGDIAVTRLTEGRWWYPTVYQSAESEHRGTYVNICTPVELFPDAARYIDLHVDVLRHADGRIERVDETELDAAVADGEVSETLAEKAREVAATLEERL
jgi:Ribonuclease G/E